MREREREREKGGGGWSTWLDVSRTKRWRYLGHLKAMAVRGQKGRGGGRVWMLKLSAWSDIDRNQVLGLPQS